MKKMISVLLVLLLLCVPLTAVQEEMPAETKPSIVYTSYDGELICGITDIPSEGWYVRLSIYFDKSGYAIYFVPIDRNGEFYLTLHEWCRFITARLLSPEEVPDMAKLTEDWPVHGRPLLIKQAGDI